ncbi:hypothetical protein [Parvularcula oceani]|uniref:hypothetical protein n=1 Tax=Parvularcula oceani TaxID=1247963 RepID=UPI0004E242B5|nr:hypothetical protein [Parvularcula oceani]
MTTKRHQIRLSGDPHFQDCLRRARVRLCTEGVSDGRIADVARHAVRLATPEEIISAHDGGCSPATQPPAKAPDPTSMQLVGEAAVELNRMRGELIARGAEALNLRAIVHCAICILAEKRELAFPR